MSRKIKREKKHSLKKTDREIHSQSNIIHL